MLNITQLRSFYETAKHLSFSRAARELYVSQPAVTAQTRLFEEFCKTKLLFRNKTGTIGLTEEGKRIFRHANKLFQIETELEQYILDLQKLRTGYLRVGTTKTYARRLMPSLMIKFHEMHPNVLIELDEGSSRDMCRSVLNCNNSIAIVAKVEDNPDLVFSPLMKEEILLIASSEHKWANKKAIKLEEINGQPVIMKELGSGTNKLIEEYLHERGIGPNIIAKTSNMAFIIELVKQMRAIAFVVRTSVEKELSDGDIVSIGVQDCEMLLDIYIASLRDFELPPCAKAFFDFAMTHLQSLHCQSLHK